MNSVDSSCERGSYRDGGLIERFVWDEAGFSFRDDGVYVVDFGWEWKVGSRDGLLDDYSKGVW